MGSGTGSPREDRVARRQVGAERWEKLSVRGGRKQAACSRFRFLCRPGGSHFVPELFPGHLL